MTNSSKQFYKEHLARVRWHCRRGMLELDEILLNFFDKNYLQLAKTEQKFFEKLLDCTDPELFNWLLGHKVPANVEFQKIVRKIRATHLPTLL